MAFSVAPYENLITFQFDVFDCFRQKCFIQSNKERLLIDRKQRISNIPGLKQGKEWILEPVEKTNCFVTAFESKTMMPD